MISEALTDSDLLLKCFVVAKENIPSFKPVTCQGKWADSSNLDHFGKVIGIGPGGGISSGFTGKVSQLGEVENAVWNWSEGDIIWLNGSELSKIAPADGFLQRIGIAKSPTVILVELGECVLL